MPARTQRPTSVRNSIRRIRMEKGYSTRGLAAKAGVDQSQVVRWENGSQGLMLTSAIVLAGALEVSVEDLMAPPPAVPNSIRRLRQRRGFTAAQLADRAGVTEKQLSVWENGLGDLTLESATGLARALAVSVEMLVGPPAQPETPPPLAEEVQAW